MPKFDWYEFFAGGGMARLGLGRFWRCLLANEWRPEKAATYVERFGSDKRELIVSDVADLHPGDLPGHAHLAWASFPCQDLSLAGPGAGLTGRRSGAFLPFWDLMERLAGEGRPPWIVVLENVVGTLTSRGGADFANLMHTICGSGYRAGALVIDAAQFLPQSRPRLFIIAVRKELPIPERLRSDAAPPGWRRPIPPALAADWVWWELPDPDALVPPLSSLIEDRPLGVRWHTPQQTARLLSLMSARNLQKVVEAQAAGVRTIGTVYRRMRTGPDGRRIQRAEVRFDGVAGCLRTPAGGSSRQIVLEILNGNVHSRLLSAGEAARLMGVDPERYPIPQSYSEAYHLFGDGVVVPVVAHLERHILRPLARAAALLGAQALQLAI